MKWLACRLKNIPFIIITYEDLVLDCRRILMKAKWKLECHKCRNKIDEIKKKWKIIVGRSVGK